MRALFDWKIMGVCLPDPNPGTSTSGISGSRIKSRRPVSQSVTVQPGQCLPTSLRSLCKDNYSGSSWPCYLDMPTLTPPPGPPVEERVGEGRFDPKVNPATGVVVTGTGSDSTVIKEPKVTWADVARKPATHHKMEAAGSVSADRGQEVLMKYKFVSRSFY